MAININHQTGDISLTGGGAPTIGGVSIATNLGITNGTTAGPIITSSTGTNATLPTASGTISGVVTTGAQTWAGIKTFSSQMLGASGTLSLPGYAFSGDTNTGMYRVDGNNFGLVQNGTERLRVSTTGIAVTGVLSATGEVTATLFTVSSKREVKENIYPFNLSALDIVNTVDVVTYNYKEDESKNLRIGFIADDTDSLLSGTNKDKFDATNVISVLLKAVQELSAKVNELEGKLNA